MSPETEDLPNSVFDIPDSLSLDSAEQCLAELRQRVASVQPPGKVTIGLPPQEPTQLALELLHSAQKSAEAGMPIDFTDDARAIIAKTAPPGDGLLVSTTVVNPEKKP